MPLFWRSASTHMIENGSNSREDELQVSSPARQGAANQGNNHPITTSRYGQLDLAISRMQRSTSKTPSPQRKPSLPTVQEERSEDAASTSRRSSSSGSTISGDRQNWDVVEAGPAHQRIVPFLPTIDSGEPLSWDEFRSQHSGEDDPFSDGAPPIRYTGGPRARPQYSSYDSERSRFSSSRPLPARPPSSLDAPELDHRDSNPYIYKSPVRMLSGNSPVDHFRYDTEAYASGTFSRAPYRSRSPTPAVDDEDYQIMGDGSVHYTGVTNLSSQSHDRDQDYYTQDTMSDSQYVYEDVDDEDDEEEFDEDEDEGEDDDDDDDVDVDEGDAETMDEKTSAFFKPATPVTTMHFGPAPSGRIHRRHKKRRVQLTNGNLVVDLTVPPKLILPLRSNREMGQTRYTAITCDPDEFEKKGFFLKQNDMNRTTELFICITVYNEDEVLFCRTMYGVMKNIAHLCTRKNSRTWGKDAWKKVVVCIVADGRKKIHPRVLDCLTLLGVYQPGDHMKNMVNNKPVAAHLFEYTTSFALDPNLRFQYPDKGIVPTQILFCMKERNQKKINSHRWFFNAFARMLQPNICALLDVGTRPSSKSLYYLWKTFDLNSNVGGACGEIAAYKGKNWIGLLNPLVAAQNFEYKISNILDKPMESLFGYISVLPGAFSAYRYIALQNDKTGRGPLASYFKGEVLHGRDTDIFTSNMYLAEDRILCFELVAKANSNWVLRYVKNAIGETDVPDGLPEFIAQRRRWLNGSFFAATYSIAHVGQVLRSGHSLSRKAVLMMETIYNTINLIFSWFSIGNFYLFFIILTSSLEATIPAIKWCNYFIQYLLSGLIVACFLFSMGNKPRAIELKYKIVATLFALLMMYLIAAAVICAIQAAKEGGNTYRVMLFSIIITYGAWAASSLLAFDPWHMITSCIPYLLLSPTYINVLNIYAYSNLDDISWGTKQDDIPDTDLGAVIQDSLSQVDVEVLADAADVNRLYEDSLENLKTRKPVDRKKARSTVAEVEQAAKDYYASVRTNILLAWVLSNAILAAVICNSDDLSLTFRNSGALTTPKAYMTFVLVFVAFTGIIRFLASTMYLVARIFTG